MEKAPRPPTERAHLAVLELVCSDGDLDLLREWIAEEHVLHQSVIEGLPAGLGGVIRLATFYRKALAWWAVSVEDHLVEGDRAVTRFHVTARHDGPLGAISPTERPLEIEGLLASRFEGGRAVESWLEVGALGVLRDLGAGEMVNPVRLVES